jgi:hypothetical protein
VTFVQAFEFFIITIFIGTLAVMGVTLATLL